MTSCCWGHCAKPNPQWRYLQARPRALVSFLGPHAYLSPSVYPDLARVPTWNYLAVHCTVEARLVEGADEKDALLKRLIGAARARVRAAMARPGPGLPAQDAQRHRRLRANRDRAAMQGQAQPASQANRMPATYDAYRQRHAGRARAGGLDEDARASDRAGAPEMRHVAGWQDVLVALVVVGLLARKQLGGVAAPVLPAASAGAA